MNGFEVIEARKNSGLSQKVIYQLFLRLFTPEGTIKAATEKLEHIASLGVDIVYLVSFCESDDDRQVCWIRMRTRSSYPSFTVDTFQIPTNLQRHTPIPLWL